MNILDAFGGLQRISMVLLGVLVVIIGVAFIIAGSKTVGTVVGTVSEVLPVGKIATAVKAAT